MSSVECATRWVKDVFVTVLQQLDTKAKENKAKQNRTNAINQSHASCARFLITFELFFCTIYNDFQKRDI